MSHTSTRPGTMHIDLISNKEMKSIAVSHYNIHSQVGNWNIIVFFFFVENPRYKMMPRTTPSRVSTLYMFYIMEADVHIILMSIATSKTCKC